MASAISYFNPRSPCGLRLNSTVFCYGSDRFQSTQPMRAATNPSFSYCLIRYRFQSTQPMRAATKYLYAAAGPATISIHAAHAGCDKSKEPPPVLPDNFNPRSPCGLRLPQGFTWDFFLDISIHAAHAGCDFVMGGDGFRFIGYFNPRSPCGLRRNKCKDDFTLNIISIHAAHAGCDSE